MVKGVGCRCGHEECERDQNRECECDRLSSCGLYIKTSSE